MKKIQAEYHGYGAYQRVTDIVEALKPEKIMVVRGLSYDNFPVKRTIETLPIPVVYFKEFSPNPDIADISKGVALFEREKCDFIVSVGGGSVIDVAKSINIFSFDKNNTLRLLDDVSCPHLSVPTTAGSGSEATQYAIIYKNSEKMSLEHPDLLPEYVILDPVFLETLPAYQKKSTLLDALCQAIESIWANAATNESKKFAKEAISIIFKNAETYFSGEPEANTLMLEAANLSGKAIAISRTTVPHAMSYKLAATFGLAHGHAVALCLLYILEDLLESFSENRDTGLGGIIGDLAQAAQIPSREGLFDTIKGLFLELRLYRDFDFSEDLIKELVASVNTQRLSNHPIEITTAKLAEIYRRILSNEIYK